MSCPTISTEALSSAVESVVASTLEFKPLALEYAIDHAVVRGAGFTPYAMFEQVEREIASKSSAIAVGVVKASGAPSEIEKAAHARALIDGCRELVRYGQWRSAILAHMGLSKAPDPAERAELRAKEEWIRLVWRILHGEPVGPDDYLALAPSNRANLDREVSRMRQAERQIHEAKATGQQDALLSAVQDLDSAQRSMRGALKAALDDRDRIEAPELTELGGGWVSVLEGVARAARFAPTDIKGLQRAAKLTEGESTLAAPVSPGVELGSQDALGLAACRATA